MLGNAIVYYIILYCTTLHYTELYYTTLHYTILIYTILHYTTLYCMNYTILNFIKWVCHFPFNMAFFGVLTG